MFTDVVDSTAQRQRLGERRAEDATRGRRGAERPDHVERRSRRQAPGRRPDGIVLVGRRRTHLRRRRAGRTRTTRPPAPRAGAAADRDRRRRRHRRRRRPLRHAGRPGGAPVQRCRRRRGSRRRPRPRTHRTRSRVRARRSDRDLTEGPRRRGRRVATHLGTRRHRRRTPCGTAPRRPVRVRRPIQRVAEAHRGLVPRPRG